MGSRPTSWGSARTVHDRHSFVCLIFRQQQQQRQQRLLLVRVRLRRRLGRRRRRRGRGVGVGVPALFGAAPPADARRGVGVGLVPPSGGVASPAAAAAVFVDVAAAVAAAAAVFVVGVVVGGAAGRAVRRRRRTLPPRRSDDAPGRTGVSRRRFRRRRVRPRLTDSAFLLRSTVVGFYKTCHQSKTSVFSCWTATLIEKVLPLYLHYFGSLKSILSFSLYSSLGFTGFLIRVLPYICFPIKG